MKCGNCKDDHPTSAMVLMCYKKAGKVKAAATADQRSYTTRHHDGRRDSFRQLKQLGSRVDEGPYAIRNAPGGQNDISFYEVQKPTEGKWAGYTFVKRRASDETINTSVAESVRVLTAIVADPVGASLLFGQAMGICPECGRSLTKQESRDRGIGPVCARKRGYGDVA